MTQNIFSQDIGDLGSAATVISPVKDESGDIAARGAIEAARNKASLINQTANLLYTAGPVVQEMAGNAWANKNLVGDTDVDISDKIKTEVTLTTNKQELLANEVQYQRSVNVQDLSTLSELEAARKQGLISFDEMQMRAQALRNNAINRAPLFKEQTDNKFRQITGTSTGTASISAAASPWEMTPEEEAFREERKINAAFAAEHNIDLVTADKWRAELANYEQQSKMQVNSDADLNLYTSNEINSGRAHLILATSKFTDESGAFKQESIPLLQQTVDTWEQQTVQKINDQIATMLREGKVIDPDIISGITAKVKATGDQFRKSLEDRDQASFMAGMANKLNNEGTVAAWEFAPNVMLLKNMNVDATKMIEMGITQGDRLTGYMKQNPMFARMFNLANMDGSNTGATVIMETFNSLLGDSAASAESVAGYDDTTSSQALLATMNASPVLAENSYVIARESGTFDKIEKAYMLQPEAIVHLKNSSLWKVPPTSEELSNAYQAAAAGIFGGITADSLGVKSDFAIWVNPDGKVGMNGNGVSEVTKGRAQDLYETILANEEIWKGEYKNAGQYLQSLFPGRSYTYTGEVTAAVENLQSYTSDEQVALIKKDPSKYATTTEDMEATTEILHNKLMSITPTLENSQERMELNMLIDDIWEFNGKLPEQSSAAQPAQNDQYADLTRMLKTKWSNLDLDTINEKLSPLGLEWDGSTLKEAAEG